MTSYIKRKNADIHFGTNKEKSLLATIQSQFGSTITQSRHRYCIYDFSNDDTVIELKSRHVRHNQYPTALIGENKIKCFRKKVADGIKVYLLFNYTDGLFYVKYTGKEIWECKTLNRQGRGKDEISNVYHIPYQCLTKIN